jgi:hypothetical protein
MNEQSTYEIKTLLWKDIQEFQYGGSVYLVGETLTLESLNDIVKDENFSLLEEHVSNSKVEKIKWENLKSFDEQPEKKLNVLTIGPYIFIQEILN